jgi:hypothetical protein
MGPKLRKSLWPGKKTLWPVFGQNKIFKPQQSLGWMDLKFFSDQFWYLERQNPSSYAKTRPVSSLDSELEDKTGIMRTKVVTVARVWWKQWGKHTNWTLTQPNQQQALDQDTNSTQRNLKRIMQKAKHGFWDTEKNLTLIFLAFLWTLGRRRNQTKLG